MNGSRKLGLAAGGLAAIAALAAAEPRAQSPRFPASFADGSGGAASAKYAASDSSSASASASASSRASARASSSATANSTTNSSARHSECSSEAEASTTQDGVTKTVRQVRKATGDGGACSASSSAKARVGPGAGSQD